MYPVNLTKPGKALKNRTIPFQAFADRLVVATQLFRPSLGAAGFKMRVEIIEVPEPWHRHQEVPAAIADDPLDLALVVRVNGGAKRDHLGGVRRDHLAAAGLSP